MNDDTPVMNIAQAIAALVLSRLVTAGIVAVLVHGGFDAMLSTGRILSKIAMKAQMQAELSHMREETAPVTRPHGPTEF